MKDTEIDALPAGPEMDRAVAEMLGLKLWWSEHHPESVIVTYEDGGESWLPPYSTDAGVAIAALERWANAHPRRCYEVSLFCREADCPPGPKYYVELEYEVNTAYLTSRADTLALAVCRALLKAEAGRKGKE